MTRRTIDAAVLLVLAANAHHAAVLAARYLEARLVSRNLPACDLDQLFGDVEHAPAA